MSQQKVFSQIEIEQNGATILGRPLSENLSLEQVFGPVQNWLLQLGPYHLLYMPIHDRWLYWDWVHETWQDTGHKAFEVEFFLDGDQVKTRPVSARPAPSHDLAQQTFAQQAVPDLPDEAAPAFGAVEATAVSPFAFSEPEPAAAPLPEVMPFEPEPYTPEPVKVEPEIAAPEAAEPVMAVPYGEFPSFTEPEAPALAPEEPFVQPIPAVQPEEAGRPESEMPDWLAAAASATPVQESESPGSFGEPLAGHTAPMEVEGPEPAPVVAGPAPAWPEPPAIPLEAAPPLPQSPVPTPPVPSAPLPSAPVVPTPVGQVPVTPAPAEPAPQPVTPPPAAPPVQVQQPVTPAPATPPAGSKASTAPFTPSTDEPTPVPQPRRAADEYAATMLYKRPVVWELRVVEGPMAAIVYRLKPLTTVGRSSDNVISLDDPMSSRHHARLEWAGENYILFDQGSSNGTFVNEKRISEPAILQEGDLVLIGQTKFIVQKHEG